MKRKGKSLLCVALLVALCLMLTACKSEDVSGLGKLTMEDGPDDDTGVGTLGEPDGTPAPETPQTPAPETPQTPAPETPQTPAPETPQSPAPSGMSTEKYECDAFNVTIPAGWQVQYDIFDAGNGTNHIIISVTDPSDSNNSFFFLTALEPFFTSVTAKNLCLPYVAGYYAPAPVMGGTPSAEATLTLWPDIFAVLQGEGLGYDAYFRGYTVKEVIGTVVAENSTNTDMTSAVTAYVTIPGAEKRYQMYFQNNLVLDDPAAGLPSDATYYRSYSNYGAVLREDLADQFGTLQQCLGSFEFKSA